MDDTDMARPSVGGALTAGGLLCGSCGTELRPNSKFCNECGTPVTHVSRSAEYKQVTVLFADVVHSMDIAAAVGAERLREIMVNSFSDVIKYAEKHKVHNRTAAYMLALDRVQFAIKLRGLYA